MKKFIAGRVEVCLGYDFEKMNKENAIEKCKELGQDWRLPNYNEIKYICGNLAYCGISDFWKSPGTIGKIINRRGPHFKEPVYWINWIEADTDSTERSFVYDCQFMGNRCFQIKKNKNEIDCVFLAVREI